VVTFYASVNYQLAVVHIADSLRLFEYKWTG